jgi:hypothetical protein
VTTEGWKDHRVLLQKIDPSFLKYTYVAAVKNVKEERRSN